MTNKVYDLITERILTQLDNGVVPWRKPWGLQPGLMPMNGTNSREYKGINGCIGRPYSRRGSEQGEA